MPCHSPLTAWKSRDLDDINPTTGKLKMVFKADLGYPATKTELPCGQCMGCRLDRARSWAARCLHESSLYLLNCFVTLTYTDENVPDSLNKHDISNFMKALRKRHPDITIRFFQCGEYGDLFQRPHHHVLLFNYFPPDASYFKHQGGNNYFISKEISCVWPHGFHLISEVTYDSACYTAKYCLKKITGKPAAEHYQTRLPEFITMSRRPGIGKDWFDKFQNDVYNYDKIVLANNHILRPPRYYDVMFENHNPSAMRSLKTKRRKNASLNPENCEERREIKRKLAILKEQALKKRNFENIKLPTLGDPLRGAAETGVKAYGVPALGPASFARCGIREIPRANIDAD